MILEVKNLSFGFPQKPLVSHLSFQVTEPCFVAVIGHNGSGKSTFFKTLLSRQHYSGAIFIKEKNIQAISRSAASGSISCLEQKNNLSFDIKVIDLVMMGRFRFKKFFSEYNQEDREIAVEAMRSLEICHLEEKEFLSLSGGEQQLVWLAQLSVQDMDIILLDEPTQQLDLYNKKRMFDEMAKWVKEKGKLVMCITHDIQNLYEMNGYFINFSEDSPALRKIDTQNLDQHLKILQTKNTKNKTSIPEVL